MKKNLYSKILKGEPKEQHINIVPKSCSFIYVYLYIIFCIKFIKCLCILQYTIWKNQKSIHDTYNSDMITSIISILSYEYFLT